MKIFVAEKYDNHTHDFHPIKDGHRTTLDGARKVAEAACPLPMKWAEPYTTGQGQRCWRAEEVVDLETRVATAEASVARTRALMERAESIDDIVRVEAELSEREAALASLQARQRRLADLTTLSTITATLLARSATPAAEPDGSGFLAGLAAGWRGFTGSLTVLLTGFGVLLPWLVAIGVPATAGVWWARRRAAAAPPG